MNLKNIYLPTTNTRKTPFAFWILAIIGLIVSLILYIPEKTEYNTYYNLYQNHTHSILCDELVCDEDEHTHSNLCYDCGYNIYSSWHTHNTSCYCSKTEHTHTSDCYRQTCEYSMYSSPNAYAGSRVSYALPLSVFVVSLIIMALNLWLTFGADSGANTTHSKLMTYYDNFFNEESDTWLNKLKFGIKILFWLEFIGFIIIGLIDWRVQFTRLGDFSFIVWSGVGFLITLASKNANMVMLQFLTNVNKIRLNTSNNNEEEIITEATNSVEEEIENMVESDENIEE